MEKVEYKFVSIGISVKLNIDDVSDEIYFHKLLNNIEELRSNGFISNEKIFATTQENFYYLIIL